MSGPNFNLNNKENPLILNEEIILIEKASDSLLEEIKEDLKREDCKESLAQNSIKTYATKETKNNS